MSKRGLPSPGIFFNLFLLYLKSFKCGILSPYWSDLFPDFVFFLAIVNVIFFLISFSENFSDRREKLLTFVYCLYPATLQKVYLNPKSFLLEFLVSHNY